MRRWTQEETNLLIEKYNVLQNEDLYRLFPGRSPLSIYKRAYSIGLRKTEEISRKNRCFASGKRFAKHQHDPILSTKGYVLVYLPEHHRADSKGRVFQHIVVFEESTGIIVPSDCVVHHINGNKQDNRIENLCLMTTGAHTALHHSGTKHTKETREKISAKAKARLADKRNHPSYKDVDVSKLLEMRNSGVKIDDICKYYGITKRTYYNKVEDYKNAQSHSN